MRIYGNATLSTAAEHAVYFKEFIKSLAEKFQPLQIFCFAKSSILNESSGCFIDDRSAYTCNYCLLLVTESNTRIDFEVQEFANRYYKQGSMIILSHSRESLENAINTNDRFFITASTIGQLIYSHDGITHCDTSVPFIPTQSAVKANRDLSHRIPFTRRLFKRCWRMPVQGAICGLYFYAAPSGRTMPDYLDWCLHGLPDGIP